MAKSKGISGYNEAVKLNSGRVGNIRYYQRGGKTYTRSTTVSNPSSVRTEKQRRVRTMVANIAHFYNAISKFAKGGFEAYDGVRSDYNIFYKLAFYCKPVYFTKEQAAQGSCVAAAYPASQGSLPKISYALNGSGILVSDISLGALTIDASTTIGEFAKAIVDNNVNFEYGDTITFAKVLQLGTEDDPYVRASAVAVDIIENDPTKLLDVVTAEGFSVVGGYLGMSAAPVEGVYAWVHARKNSNGKKRISTQYFFDANLDVTEMFSSEEQFWAACDSYGEINEDPFYYNGGNEGGEPTPPSTKKTIVVKIADYCVTYGKVQINDSVSDNTPKSLEVEPGTQVTIKAVPQGGYQFTNWNDADTNATRTITVNEDCEFVAEFEES